MEERGSFPLVLQHVGVGTMSHKSRRTWKAHISVQFWNSTIGRYIKNKKSIICNKN